MFFCLSSALLGCGRQSGGSNSENVNSAQTQLYVYVFSRGYGSEYLYKLKERYEALHANDSYEDGKKGVQIRINVSDDNSATKYAENVKNQKDDVFFAEDSYYRTLAQAGVLLDITDAVTSKSEYDGKTVAEKFNVHQDDYLKVDGKYYGVPHYQGEYGFVYDADLFEKKGYYFKDGYTVRDGFVANKYDSEQYGEYYSDEMFVAAGDTTTKRTAGPDRIPGNADDYSSGTLQKKPVSLRIKTANETKTYNAGEKYSVTPAANEEKAEFTIKCGEYILKTEKIAVIMPYTDGKLTVENYFVNTLGNFDWKKTPTGINFEATGSYSWTFAKDLVGNNVLAVVNGADGGGNFNRLTFKFTDSDDETVSVSVTIVKSGESYYCYAAGKRLVLTQDFNDSASSVKFGYEDGRVFVGGNYVTVSSDDSGNAFKGFPSGKIYFSMNVEAESSSQTTINLQKLCEYPFTRATKDLVAPQIVILGEYGGYYKLGDIYEVVPAVASDVLDVNVTLTLSVYDTKGNIVKSVDGITLKDVDPSVAYKIKLDEYGQYDIKYNVGDSNASDEISYAVNVPDITAPEFVFEKGFKTTAKVGDVYVIPAFTVKDNLTAAEDIEVYKYVINPDGRIIAITGNGFRFSKAGEYTFYLTAYDKAFNGKTVKVKVTVTA